MAALAGVPQSVIAEARHKLRELESPHATNSASTPPAQAQLPFDVDPRGEALLARLRNIDPDALTPREAHALLYELGLEARDL